MHVCIHRGSKQIGGSCVELASHGRRLLIDLGLPLDATKNDKQYLPKVVGLDNSDPTLLGILISHLHLDHVGLLAHVSPSIPVGMGAAARRILAAAAPFLPGNCPIPSSGWDFNSEQSFEIGPFRVTPYLVDHAAYDAYALLVESDGKRLFYSGDFRAHGRKAALFERLVAHPPTKIDALLLEGTSLGQVDQEHVFPTESDLEAQFIDAFSTAERLVLVHASAQNIDRIVTILRASKKTGRTLIIDLYTAAVLEATCNPHIPRSDWPGIALFVPQVQRRQIKKHAWFDLLHRHAKNRVYLEQIQATPENFVMLFRPLHTTDLEQGNCLKGAMYIYSQWEGYWEQGKYDSVKAWLADNDLPKRSLHTSGHACLADLRTFVHALSPGKVVPIHSFYPERYFDVFAEVELHEDGVWWEL